MRRIRALREMEMSYLREMERVGGNDAVRMPFLTPLAFTAALERGDLPLTFGNPIINNRLRLMLSNRDFTSDDYEALMQLEEG